MSCDSFFGIALFVFSATLVVYAILGYYYVLASMINLVAAEFRRSKFIDILTKLIRIREDEEESFTVSAWPARLPPVAVPYCVVWCSVVLCWQLC